MGFFDCLELEYCRVWITFSCLIAVVEIYSVMMCVWIIFRECLMSVGLLQLGSTAIGVKTKEGVVLAVEKRITSPLLVWLLTLNYTCFL